MKNEKELEGPISELNLALNSLTCVGVMNLLLRPSILYHLTSLNLEHNNSIGDKGLIFLIDNIFLRSLVDLNLTNTGIGRPSTSSILKIHQGFPSLELLVLKENSFPESDKKAIEFQLSSYLKLSF